MNPFDFVDWLDENAKHMARFTLNGESLGIIREGEKYSLGIEVDGVVNEVAEFKNPLAAEMFKNFLRKVVESS